MRIDDLHPGLQVYIIEWFDERPEHWSEEGDMDEWQGQVVTISEVYEDSEEIFIEDDEHCWQWHPWDFEPYCNLSQDDPNIRYRLHKHETRMAKLRAGLKR